MRFKEYLEEAKSGAGAAMSDELSVGLAKANVPKEVIDALRAAMLGAAANPYALTYAHAMTKSFNGYGVDGVKHQVMYMLGNLAAWKGDEAREAKKVLKKWTK